MLGSVWSLSTSENPLLHFTDEDRRDVLSIDVSMETPVISMGIHFSVAGTFSLPCWIELWLKIYKNEIESYRFLRI